MIACRKKTWCMLLNQLADIIDIFEYRKKSSTCLFINLYKVYNMEAQKKHTSVVTPCIYMYYLKKKTKLFFKFFKR